MSTPKSARVHVSILLAMVCFVGLGSGCRSSIGMGDAVDETTLDESGKIPTKAFMGNPLFSHVTLSPNGRRIAVMVSRGDTDALIAIDLFDGTRTALAKLERRDSSHSTASNKIDRVGWASNDFVVMSAERPNLVLGVRSRRTVLLSSSVRDPRVRELGKDWNSTQQYEDRVISYLPDDPDRLLISWHGKAQQVDLKASSLRGVVLDKTNVAGWMADHEFKVRDLRI